MFGTHDYNCPFVVSTDEKSYACDCGHISSMDCCTICDPFRKKVRWQEMQVFELPEQLHALPTADQIWQSPEKWPNSRLSQEKSDTGWTNTDIYTSSACYPFLAMWVLIWACLGELANRVKGPLVGGPHPHCPNWIRKAKHECPSLWLYRSSPPILAGSDIMSLPFSLSAGRPITGANLYLMASYRGCKLSSVWPVVLNSYLHLFTTPWVKAQKAAWGWVLATEEISSSSVNQRFLAQICSSCGLGQWKML